MKAFFVGAVRPAVAVLGVILLVESMGPSPSAAQTFNLKGLNQKKKSYLCTAGIFATPREFSDHKDGKNEPLVILGNEMNGSRPYEAFFVSEQDGWQILSFRKTGRPDGDADFEEFRTKDWRNKIKKVRVEGVISFHAAAHCGPRLNFFDRATCKTAEIQLTESPKELPLSEIASHLNDWIVAHDTEVWRKSDSIATQDLEKVLNEFHKVQQSLKVGGRAKQKISPSGSIELANADQERLNQMKDLTGALQGYLDHAKITLAQLSHCESLNSEQLNGNVSFAQGKWSRLVSTLELALESRLSTSASDSKTPAQLKNAKPKKDTGTRR
jgi:hypothetical protein